MMRRRRATSVVASVALVAGAFALLPPRAADAHAGTTTATMNCLAYPQNSLAGGPQAAPTDATFTVTAPDEVLVGETFTETVQMAAIDVPTANSGYNVNNMKTLRAEIPDPANATVNSVSISGGSAGWVMTRSAGKIVLTNANSFAPPTQIQIPLITYSLTATGSVNSTIEYRLGGAPTYNDNTNPSLNLTINIASPIGALDVILKCYAPGTPPVSLHSTAIVPPDTTGPSITINSPANGASYAVGQSVVASFSCSDKSGVTACTGSQANGTSIDTTTPGNYTFTVNATDGKGNTSSATASYAVVNLPVVQIHGGTRTESGGPVPFTVTLTKPANVTVDLATVDGTATDVSDYVAATPTVTFTAGGTLSQTVDVELQDDSIAEDPESFSLVATGQSGDSVAYGTSVAGRVIDDDQGGDVAAACGSAVEGGTITCTVQLLRPPTVATTVHYATSNGTATAPADYTATSGDLTFQPGVYPMTQTVTVATSADSVYEGDPEAFAFSATVTGGGSASDDATIAEGTTVPPKMYIQDLALKETDPGGGTNNNARIRLTLDKPATAPVTVNACTQNVTATAGSDYVRTCPTVTFQPGQIWKEVLVGVTPDTAPEGDETLKVKLQGLVGPVLMGDSEGEITIVDDDAPTATAVDVSVSDLTIWEGDVQGGGSNTNAALVNISLSHPLSVPVVIKWQVVPYAAAPGMATKGSDFQQSTLPGTPFGSVKIGAGAHTAQAKVNILPDSQQEGTERFRVTFFAHHPSVALNYLKPVGVVTILDDDPLTPGTPGPIEATRSAAQLGGVDVSWDAPSDDGGTAVYDYDYRVSTDGFFDTETWAPTGAGTRTSMTGIACGASCMVQVRAVNAAGQGPSVTSDTLSGYSETTAPGVLLTAPVSGSNLDKDAGITFAGDVGIDPTDTAPVTVDIYAGTTATGTPERTLTTSSSTGTFSVATTALPTGIHTAVARQSDWAGNVGTSDPVTIEVRDAVFVAPNGSDAAAGTAAAPKQTLAAAITAAGANGQIVVGIGAYSAGDGGIAPLDGQVIKGGFNPYNGWTRPGTAGVGGQPNPLDTAVSATTQAMLVSGAKTVAVDGLALDGLNTGLAAGSSVYGVRAVSGAVVTLDNVSVSAAAGVAATNSAAVGTNQSGVGCNGNNGATGSGGAGGTSCNSTTATGARGGAGGRGGGLLSSGSAGQTGGCGTASPATGIACSGTPTNPELGGGGGSGGGVSVLCISPTGAGVGGGGLGGAGGAAGTGATNSLSGAGVTYAGLSGGTSGAGAYGRGGGGGGGGSCSQGGGGAGGAGGPTGGGTVTGGAAGGGSFGIYAFNATVTVSNSTVSSAAGGAGGKGGTGGSGARGGNGGTGSATRAAGGGGGGGAGGGGGGGGGAGGPSISVFHTGTGGVTSTSNTLSRSTSAAAGGLGGVGGAGGAGGTGGTGSAGTGIIGATGGSGTTGQPGATGQLCKTYVSATCTA